MTVFHLCYDLDAYYGMRVMAYLGAFADIWARSTACVFLVLCGIGLALSRERALLRGEERNAWMARIVRRGMGVLCCGCAISLVTFLIDASTYVRFGILHCIGCGLIVLAPLAARPRRAAWAAVAATGAWLALRGTTASTPLLLPLGITPPGFASVDYFPLLPWAIVLLLGIAAMRPCREATRWLDAHVFPPTRAVDWAALPGRWSLVIYLVHQPILLAVLTLLLGLPR